MPTIATKPNPAAKFENELEEQLSLVVRRIRTHDLLCGAILLGVVALGYLAAMMSLDRWLELPVWVRQIGFLGLLVGLGTVAYYGLVRPFRRTVNPIYAAKEVEATIDDAKNGVINWVDLQGKPMAEGVRNAVASRAAKQLKNADLEKAGESKQLLWLSGLLGGLVVALAVLFMLFKPTVFGSLFGRAVNPFTSGSIATRTQLTITEPTRGDLTITAGQPVTITVQVTGKVPPVDSPERIRLLLRHNQADENYDEVPLESGSSYREWTIRLPDRLIQNGFWYKVAGGDTETNEHRVIVRPRPLFTEFELKYEYPEYLRMPPDTVRLPHIEAYRGTIVTLRAKANRTLKEGRAEMTQPPSSVPGEIVGENKDTLQVRLTLTDSGTYRLLFTSTEGEANTDAPVYDLRVLIDQPPTVTITAPKDEETVLPINGTLSVDGRIADDFGIDKVTLKLKLTAPNQPPRMLKAKPYQNGQSFRREADGTFPDALDYKDSVALPKLLDEAGKPVELKPDTVIEYWIEAVDNCTVPTANVGKSKVQKVRLEAVKEEPKKDEAAKQQAEKRQREEAEHQKKQKEKLAQEQRERKPSPQKQNAEPKEGEPEMGDKQEGQPGEKQPGKPGEQSKSEPGQKGEPAKPDGDPKQPMDAKGQEGEQPMDKGTPDAEKQDIQKKAEEIRKEIEKNEKQAGDAKPNAQPQAGQDAPSSEKKPQPMDADAKDGAAEAKPQPKSADEKNNSDPKEKEGPLGGSNAGSEKPSPEKKEPKEKKPEGQPDQSPMEPKAGEPSKEPQPGDARGQKPTPAAEAKKGPKSEPMNEQKADAKPMGDDKQASQEKGEGKSEPMGNQPQKGGQPNRGEQKSTPSGANEGSEQQENEQLAKDLTGNDAQKKQAAREKLDQKIGKENREKIEQNTERRKQTADDLQSKEPMQQQRGQENLTDLQREQMERAKGEKPQTREKKDGDAEQLNRKETEQNLKDLNSDDKQKQDAAKDKLDKSHGQEARKEAEKLRDELKAGDKNPEKAAEDELTKAQKKQEQNAQGQGEKGKDGLSQEQKKDIEQAAKDLAGNDEKKKQEARDKLDKAVGKENREKAELQMNERQKAAEKLQSKDPMQQKEGQDKASELQKKELEAAAKEQKQKSGDGKPTDQQKLEQAAKDLNSDDPKKKEAAQKQLDEMVGKDAREKAQKMMDDLKSGDKDRQKGAMDELKKLQEQAEKMAKENQEKGENKLTPEEIQKLAEAAKDLNSADEKKKQDAEKKLDEKLGEQARKQIQEQLKDGKMPTPEQTEAMKKALEELAKNQPKGGPGNNDRDPRKDGPIGGNTGEDFKKPIEANKNFDKAAAELQLENFKKIKENKELMENLKKRGYTEEEYERFLKGYEKMAKELPATKSDSPMDQPMPNAATRPTTRIDGAGKIEQRTDGSKGTTNSAGVTNAPPGYGDARRKFGATASQQPKEKDEKK